MPEDVAPADAAPLKDGEDPKHPAVEGPESALEDERKPEKDVHAELESLRLEAERLRADVEAARREAADHLERARRALADFDNFRRRAQADASAAGARAKEALLGDLLPVLDSFDRALAAGGDADALRDGMRLVHRQLVSALDAQGVERIECVGKPFDPAMHEAVMRAPSAEHAEGTVLEEFEGGYRVGGRVLRPARVKVAAPPE